MSERSLENRSGDPDGQRSSTLENSALASLPDAAEPIEPVNDRPRVLITAVAVMAGTTVALQLAGVTLWVAALPGLIAGIYAVVFGAVWQTRLPPPLAWRMVQEPPDDVREAIRAAADEVARLGFVPRGVAYARFAAMEYYAWGADHPVTNEVAALQMQRKLGPQGRLESSLGFAIRLRGGRRQVTLTSPDPLESVADAATINFPSVTNAAALYHIHRLLTASVRGLVEPPPAGSLADRLRQRDEIGRQELIRTGWLRRDGDEIRWTVKATVRLTALFLPPGRWLLRLARRIQARRLLALPAAAD